jgi:hypothetical protein
MVAKQDRYPTSSQSCDVQVRDETMDDEINSLLRVEGPRRYFDAYDATVGMLKEGYSPDEIRTSLNRAPHLQGIAADGTPRGDDKTNSHNRAEEILAQTRKDAIEDALAGKPTKDPAFVPHGKRIATAGKYRGNRQ